MQTNIACCTFLMTCAFRLSPVQSRRSQQYSTPPCSNTGLYDFVDNHPKILETEIAQFTFLRKGGSTTRDAGAISDHITMVCVCNKPDKVTGHLLVTLPLVTKGPDKASVCSQPQRSYSGVILLLTYSLTLIW